MRRVREILRKEIRQTLREPRMRVLLFLPPVVQLIIFGYAVNLDVELSRIAWVDQDRTPASRELRAAFAGSPSFAIVAEPGSPDEAGRLLNAGDVLGVIAVLPGFHRRIERGETAPVQILVDGTNSNTAAVVAAYAAQVVARYGADRLGERQRALLLEVIASTGIDGPRYLAVPALEAAPRVWFNEDLRSRNYFVPGVVVNIVALVTLLLTALAVVREKEIGTIEQLMVTPLRPIELMLGKTLPFAAVGLVQMTLVTLAALIIFRVPFRGSPLVLLLSAVLFLMTTLGAGLLISTVSETQQQAAMASFFFFAPAMMLSGFAFPIRNMPVAVQYLTLLNPVRYAMEIVRGLFLKGVGVETLWREMLSLFLFGSAVLGLSALRFHKRLD